MKKGFVVLLVFVMAVWALPSMAQEPAAQEPMAQEPMAQEPAAQEPMEQESMEQEPEFDIARLVMTSSVEDREPVDDKEVFDASVEKVYCFLEAIDIKSDTTVYFVWYYEDNVTANIELPIRESSRWRTYSSKKLGDRRGLWRVEVQDASGAVLRDVIFTVQ